MRIKTRCLLLSIALTWAIAASAHDWYSKECCQEHDCGEAVLVEETIEGRTFLQIKTGIKVLVPVDTPKSKLKVNEHDAKYHICVSAGDYETPPGYLYCLYEPLGS